MQKELKIEFGGGCHCGAIRYQACTPVTNRTHCHCDICRAFGGTLMTWITVQASSYSIKGQSPKKYHSSGNAFREFCASCGSHLTYRHDDFPDKVDISIGTLDDPRLFPPDNQIWGCDRLEFLSEINDLPIVSGSG